MSESAARSEPARPSLARATAVMTAGTILSRATGVIRLAVLAAVFGISETRLTDTYNLANHVPNVIYELVLGGVVTAIFVPAFVQLFETEPRDVALRAMNGVLNLALLATGALALAGIVAAPLIARFYASRLTGPEALQQEEAITFLLRLFLPQIALYALYFVVSAILNADRRFGPPMWTPIVNNLLLIGVLLVFKATYGSISLGEVTKPQLLLIGLGTTASVAPMGLLLLPYLRRAGGYRFTLDVSHPSLRKLWRLSGYVVGFVMANQLGYLVIQWLSNEQQGAFSAWIAASTFYLLPVGLFAWSISTALMPDLSSRASAGDMEGFAQVLRTGLRALVFLMVPAAVGYVVLATPIVRVLLERGIMTASSTDLVADVLTFMALGLVQFSLFQLMTRAFYALQDSRTPFLVNCAVIATIVGVGVPVFARYGVQGLAAGQGIAYTAGIAAFGLLLRRRIGRVGWPEVAAAAARVLAAAGLMGAVAWWSYRSLAGAGDVVALAAAVLLAAGCYLGAVVALRVEEVGQLRALLARRPVVEA